MGKTIVEKIMAKAAGENEVSPGEYLQFGIKDTFIQVGSDVGPRTIEAFAKLGWDKLWDPSKVIIAPEHCGSYSRARDKARPTEPKE